MTGVHLKGQLGLLSIYLHQYLVNVSVCTIRLVNMSVKGQTILTNKPNQGEAMS